MIKQLVLAATIAAAGTAASAGTLVQVATTGQGNSGVIHTTETCTQIANNYYSDFKSLMTPLYIMDTKQITGWKIEFVTSSANYIILTCLD